MAKLVKPAVKNLKEDNVPQQLGSPNEPKASEPKEASPMSESVGRIFVISEKALNTIISSLVKIPYETAHPIVELMKQSFQEVKPEQLKGESRS